jgi:hypothetical protein
LDRHNIDCYSYLLYKIIQNIVKGRILMQKNYFARAIFLSLILWIAVVAAQDGNEGGSFRLINVDLDNATLMADTNQEAVCRFTLRPNGNLWPDFDEMVFEFSPGRWIVDESGRRVFRNEFRIAGNQPGRKYDLYVGAKNLTGHKIYCLS